MKKTLTVLMVASITLLGCNQSEKVTLDPSKPYDLRITVTGITEEGGNIYVAVRDESNTVVAEHVVQAEEAASASTVLLKQIPAGEYDIFTFQDIDGNNMLTMAGTMPKEPLGYSGNNILAGPPQFSSTSFTLAKDSEQTVRLFDYR